MRDRIHFFRTERDKHFNPTDLSFANLQAQLDDQEANEGRVTIIDVRRGRSHVDDMKKFLKDAQQIRQKVVDIEGLVNQIRQYHRDITGAASRNEEVHKRLNQAMDDIRRLFDTVKGALKIMDDEYKAVLADSSAQDHRTADIRIMSSQYKTLERWFFDTWTEYNETQSDYRDKCKEKLTRQLLITEKKVTPAEIDEMIETGNFAVFSHNAQFQPKDIDELNSRHNDIAKLAENLKTLHEMFKDLALMVEQQGEMLNNIERNVEQSRDYVEQAQVELKEAKEIVDTTRKRKFICAAVIFVILLVVVIVIVITIKLQS